MDLESFFSGTALYIAYILIIAGAAAAILGPIITSLSNPKSLLKTLIGIVVLGVVFFIGYSLSGSEVTPKYIEYGVTSESSSKLIGGVLSMMYILLIVALISALVGWIMKLVK